jgi:hypothetical protein
MIVTACIPAVNAYLDRIVGYYGLFFLPLGAFIFIDLWVFPKLGLISNYAEKKNLLFSWPAAVAWIVSFMTMLFFYGKDNYPWLSRLLGEQPAWLASIQADLLFMVAPEWILSVILYIGLSMIQQRKRENR